MRRKCATTRSATCRRRRAIISDFARKHPELFVGVVLDSDTYMNPFFKQHEYFDFNPGMIRQFRDWLRGSGPYAGHPEPGVPDLSSYRREKPMTLDEVRKVSRRNWATWDDVEPPRKFPGSLYRPMRPGDVNIWDDHWYEEWQIFRQHIVGLHYDELSKWVHETGIPRDRIFSAQGFISPGPGQQADRDQDHQPRQEHRHVGRLARRVDSALWAPGRGRLRRHGGEQHGRWRGRTACSRNSRGWIRSGAWSSSTARI